MISDESMAENILNDISYFRLVKAYSPGSKPKNGTYSDGATFEQIVELYKFDGKFRQLLFTVIERVEVNLRCRLANYFSCKYGVWAMKTPQTLPMPGIIKSLSRI